MQAGLLRRHAALLSRRWKCAARRPGVDGRTGDGDLVRNACVSGRYGSWRVANAPTDPYNRPTPYLSTWSGGGASRWFQRAGGEAASFRTSGGEAIKKAW